MDNGTNLSQQQINSILNKAKELSSQGKAPDGDFLKSQLSSTQSEKLADILNNPEKLSEILSSPAARKLMSMLGRADKE